MTRFNERLKKQITGVDDEALARLTAHSWPGNIRELENVLERTILFSEGPMIRAADLPPEISGAAARGGCGSSGGATPVTANVPLPVPPASSIPNVTPPFGTHAPPAEGRASSLKELVRQETERVERELIVRALEETGGNVTQAARMLKISRKSLQNKMKEFGLRDRE